MSEQLIPPDYSRCQAEHLEGSFMTLGPRTMHRCEKAPTWLAIATATDEGGQFGSMTLCNECLAVFQGTEQFRIHHVSAVRIVAVPQPVSRADAEAFLVEYHRELWHAGEASTTSEAIAYDEAGADLATAFLARFS